MGVTTLLSAGVCDDRPAVVASVVQLLRGTGYELGALTHDLDGLTTAVRETSARVADVAPPLLGMSGLTAVRTLRSAAPWCEVVVLKAAGTLAVAALEAGARAAVQDDDLRSPPLRASKPSMGRATFSASLGAPSGHVQRALRA